MLQETAARHDQTSWLHLSGGYEAAQWVIGLKLSKAVSWPLSAWYGWGKKANQKKFYIWNLDDLQAYKREPRLWLAVVGPASPTQLSHLLPTMSSSWHLGRCLIHHRGNTEQLNPFNSWALIPMNSLTIELLTRVLSFAHRGLFACLDMCNNVSIHPAFGRFEQ